MPEQIKHVLGGTFSNQDYVTLQRILGTHKNKQALQKLRTYHLTLVRKTIQKSLKPEFLIIHSINLLDELDTTTDLLAKRLRKWYAFYNPEFERSISNSEKFARLIITKSRQQLLKELGLTEQDSMGGTFSPIDLDALKELSEHLIGLYALRAQQETYLTILIKKLCPNVVAITGPLLCARFIERAKSLERLSRMPASTIQVLGAEKALFRHLRNKKYKPPKHGILHEHPLVLRNKKALHGKISRSLADKIAIAAKVDYFGGTFCGDALRKGLEEKFGRL